MVTLPEEDNLIDNIEQIKIDKYATMPSTDVIEMALYYDQNSDYYFDPELTAGGLSNDTKIATAQYDPGIDAWYFSNMSAFPETTITKVPKSFFVAVRLSTTATKGTYFGIQISSTQSITPAGSVPIDNVNFHVKTSTWTVEKSPPKVFAQLTDIAAWYKVSGATEPTKQSRMFPGSDNIGMLQIGLVTQYFDGVVGGMLIERTGTGQDSDLTGVKIFMDGRDDNDDGLVDFSSNTDAAFNPADDMAITNWIPFSDYNANCSFSKSQILNGSTTRYFFVAYKVADTASISATHGARITSFDLPEGSMQAYTPVQSSLIPVIQTTSTVSVTMCDSVYYHYSTGTFQAQPNVEMMRLKLATNASTAIWEALQVERTGTGGPQDPTNPEGRNSDVKYIRIYRDSNMNQVLDLDDQLISNPETFDINNNLTKTKLITLTNPQTLNTSGQIYFISYDIGDNAVAGNSVGLKIADKNWIHVSTPNTVSPNLIKETGTGTVINTTTFDDCKSSLLPINPINLIVRSDNMTPVSSKQNSANVPLMALRLWTNRNHAILNQLNFSQTGTVENPAVTGKGQGDLSSISIWREATSALSPYGDGRFDPLTDILISSMSHSTALTPNPNFVSGVAKIAFGNQGLYISTAEVKLYVTANIGTMDLSANPTDNDTAGIKLNIFGNILIIPQTAVSDTSNSFPYASGTLKILNQDAIVPQPYAPIPTIWADPFGDDYPAMDINSDGLPDREYRAATMGINALSAGSEVYLDFNSDGINDLEDLNGDGIKNEVDLTGDGLMAMDLDGDGKLDLDFNHDGIPDRILPDSNGDGVPDIDLNSDNAADDYVPLRWTNSPVKIYAKWAPIAGASKYMFSIGKGPDETDVSVSKIWVETSDIQYTMNGVSLDGLKTTSLTGDFLETVDPSPAAKEKLYVEGLTGFNITTDGYIYVGTGKNAEIMHYSGGGSIDTGNGLKYIFNIDGRGLLGTNKQTHLSGTTVSNAFYYVRLKAKNAAGTPGPSVLLGIYRVDTQAPGIVGQIDEETSVSADKYNVKLLWGPAIDALSGIQLYEIQERMDTDPLWSKVATLPFTTLNLSLERAKGHFYYYRIRSQDNAGNWSAWSDTVQAVTGRPAEVISNVSAFPNPANIRSGQKINITYILNRDMAVKIKIFDLIGDKVYGYNAAPAELLGGGSAGTNIITWDGKNSTGGFVEPGIYICLIEVESDEGLIKKKIKIGVK
ncbi:MAG: hypothetical protein A2297_03450 [Elusimicrobia bacterium RIFOXYB2_FULL_48_7]|nr:MAG: hypothetical protein A2297_03450 [Elusimicrobia bacterium RIFOXYB2_FULL_48_7]